eukprot:GHVU01069866.1.p2 GENE.GHVU01069866.1~~GHVU01069866.1.p2  ORF type:complete len:124 (-),score=35.74 GHVU01069866.1:394-765(-)
MHLSIDDWSTRQIHEVFVDQHGAKWDSSTGQLANRGNFATVAASLEKLGASGITSVYLLGALARDNGGVLYTNRGEVLFERPGRFVCLFACLLVLRLDDDDGGDDDGDDGDDDDDDDGDGDGS